MDAMTMQKLARFKIMTRRLGGFNVDIFQLAQAGSYARETLARAQEVDNETLVLLALELAEALGLLKQTESEEKAAAAMKAKHIETKISDTKDRHNYGARF